MNSLTRKLNRVNQAIHKVNAEYWTRKMIAERAKLGVTYCDFVQLKISGHVRMCKIMQCSSVTHETRQGYVDAQAKILKVMAESGDLTAYVAFNHWKQTVAEYVPNVTVAVPDPDENIVRRAHAYMTKLRSEPKEPGFFSMEVFMALPLYLYNTFQVKVCERFIGKSTTYKYEDGKIVKDFTSIRINTFEEGDELPDYIIELEMKEIVRENMLKRINAKRDKDNQLTIHEIKDQEWDYEARVELFKLAKEKGLKTRKYYLDLIKNSKTDHDQ